MKRPMLMVRHLGRSKNPHERRDPVFVAMLGVACISMSAILVHLADAAAGTTAFFRCLLALPILGVVARLEQNRLGPRIRKERVQAAVAGLLLGIDLFLWTHSIFDIGAGIATVVGNLQVLFVAFIAWLWFHERPGTSFLLALPVVLGGVVLVAGLASHTPINDHPVAGVLYGLGSSLTYAAFIILLRRSIKESRHVAGPLADATVGATAAALICGLVFREISFSPPLHTIEWLLLLSFTSQTLGWLFIASALPRLPAALSSLLLLFQPAASLVIAYFVLSERPTLLQLLGAFLVCTGIVFAARPRVSRNPVTMAEPTAG